MIPRRRGQVRRMPTSAYDIGSELTLVLYTLAIVYGFQRLFIDTSYFVPTAAVAVSAHVLAAAVRWARGGLFVSTLVSIGGFVVTAWLLFPPTTLEPPIAIDGAALRGFGTDLELSWEQFQSVSSPAEVTAPFLLLIAIVVWVVAFLADWAAFRLRSPAEAMIPGAAVFIFGAFFSADQERVSTTIAVLVAALAFVLFHRLAETSTAGAWLGVGAAERGQASLLRVGTGLLAVTLIGGVTVAQALPGYDEPPLENFDPTTWDDPEDPRVVLSPLVDIRSRLINQPDVEVFTVQSPEKDYWRITSLDVFDGRIWRSKGSFEDAAGELDTDLPNGTAFVAVTQTFDINRLGEIWLPAAYEPTEVLSKPDDVELEYEPQSGTLIVNRETDNSDGLIYSLLSAVPSRDAASIAAAGTGIPDEISDRYLDLPDDFSERVIAQADLIVADATSPYEKALALQNYFRDPNLFQYSLDVSKGHSASRIEDFLFEVRAGYCEQFAGSYAAMARAVGLPARVAVGFTPGEYDASIDAYRVTGKHAHAWPEVWIEDIGWLRFEPTPGRGAPRDEAYTGQEESQEGVAGPVSPTTTAPSVNPNQPGPDATTIPQENPLTTTTLAPLSDRATSGIIGGVQGLSATAIFLWLAGISGVIALALTPLTYGTWRARRQRRAVAHDPRRRIGLAWSESQAAVQLMGLPVRASDTPRELVTRVAKKEPAAAEAITQLATEVTNVTYGASGTIDSSRADEAEQLTASLAKHARNKTGRRQWWWQHANPVNVWRDRVGTWGNLR
ncbi:MAG: transglutaminase-like putative cysteine protease [Verrucomicrobiales bacterium]|jgi:transglutaminase-like putative cysteine protease